MIDLLRARILVVDDDPMTRSMLSRYLARSGAQVSLAARATEALARLESKPVDLLVTDLEMPDESGLWLLERAKAHDPDLPVLLMMGVDQRRTVAAAPPPRPDAILPKPFLIDAFGSTCLDLLERRPPASYR